MSAEDKTKPASGPCESCSRFAYDDDIGDWVCLAELDEDELFQMMSGGAFECRYYRQSDDYDLSKRQARPF